MMGPPSKKKLTGYDKYVNHKTFALAVGVFLLIVLIPIPKSMLDVGVEYALGEKYVLGFFSQELFGKPYEETEQWEAMTARVLERNMRLGAMRKERALARDAKWIARENIPSTPGYVGKYHQRIQQMGDEEFLAMMQQASNLRHEDLTYESLPEKDQQEAYAKARKIQIVFAMLVFVVLCFLTEAMPLPGVAFCIGLILVFSGIVGRAEVASLYWSDAVWFIMGSLMFAAAFVKTGVDKRICLFLFSRLAKPRIGLITGILILVISPAAAFISDHALAAMFLPIAMILYSNSLNRENPADPELAKMLVITIAMACNIGGFGAPSGGARNVIMMTYMEDMFRINIGYGEWILYGFPFVIIMMPILWLLLRVRFKPKIRDLGPALGMLRQDIANTGGWSWKQIVTVIIFVVMVFGWITEKSLIQDLIGVRLGIGVIAIAGAIAYLLTGVVNWRDYQEKVDWGVVWLYAGAIILGKVLDETGAAYWLARSVLELVAPLGLNAGVGLLALGGAVTAGISQLMADGPAAACVGPITLNMAALTNPGTAMVPFMGMITAAASSMAYLLVIGTPPNAIVYASGYLEMKDFLRVGIPCLIIALVVLLVLMSTYWVALGFQSLPLQ